LNNRNAASMILAAIATFGAVLAASKTANAHHSFAMYDQSQRVLLTGRLTRYIPGPNHAQFLFELLEADGSTATDENGDPVLWGVETGPSTRIARQGVTPENFPIGTIISVQANPLRNGKNFGAVPNGTPLINCGKSFPAGGCNAETGTVYLSEND
jgi:hypothetical protein